MDIDHIDGNRENKDRTNLMVLCANCHRLKTFLNKDWEVIPTIDLQMRFLYPSLFRETKHK